MARTRNSKEDSPLLPGLEERRSRRRTRKARSVSSRAGVRKSTSRDRADRSRRTPQPDQPDSASSSAGNGEAQPGPADDSVAAADMTETSNISSLASVENKQKCTFKKQDAELTVKLEVKHVRSEPVHLLGYEAQLLLSRREGESELTDDIGYISALRVDKATDAHPNPVIAEVWRRELIKPKILDLPDDLQELARCMKALHTEPGRLRIRRLSAAARNAFTANSLLFIQKIYIRPDFARQGLLTHALAGYEMAVAQLPEWFAFAGTVLLIPGQPEGEEGDDWKDMEREEIYDVLRNVYARHGFVLWIDQAIGGDRKKGQSSESIPVMGKTLS